MIASDISSPVETMRLKSNVKMLCSRVQTIIRQRRRKQKRSMEIVSSPQLPSRLVVDFELTWTTVRTVQPETRARLPSWVVRR